MTFTVAANSGLGIVREEKYLDMVEVFGGLVLWCVRAALELARALLSCFLFAETPGEHLIQSGCRAWGMAASSIDASGTQVLLYTRCVASVTCACTVLTLSS